jgi:hypothetical protein
MIGRNACSVMGCEKRMDNVRVRCFASQAAGVDWIVRPHAVLRAKRTIALDAIYSAVRRPLFVGVASLALIAGPAIAQMAERPDVKAGDQWKFVVYYSVPSGTPNRTWLVASVSGTSIEAVENGEPLTLTRELNVIESPRDKYSNSRLLAFPLTVGKQWQYVTDWVFKPKGSVGKATVDVTVTGHEKVRVPAGEFDAFKLTSRESVSGTSPIGSVYAGETTRTYWYAPAARAIVKAVSHNPYLGPSTVELVDFDLRP